MYSNNITFSTFSTESLIRAMWLPIDDVISNFQKEQGHKQNLGQNLEQEQNLTSGDYYESPSSPKHWATESAQGELAAILTRIMQPRKNKYNYKSSNSTGEEDVIKFEPTVRYIRKLLHRYTSLIDQVDSYQIENDELLQIMMENQFRSRKVGGGPRTSMSNIRDDNVPNPLDSCHVSFIIPSMVSSDGYASTSTNTSTTSSGDTYNKNYYKYENNQNNTNNIIGIKVYPHHNDVGVQRCWEAGAALTEYLMENAYLVKDKQVCELGAGVGVTGLVIAGLCQTKSVHMTDYTNATLENLEYNCSINYDWIVESREKTNMNSMENMNNMNDMNEHDQDDSNNINRDIVTTGYLEWGDFVTMNGDTYDYAPESDDVLEDFVPSLSCRDSDGNPVSIHQSSSQSFTIASNSDVLIAADVIYDRSVIPQLVQVVKTILTMRSPSRSPSETESENETESKSESTRNKKKIAIFATTFRHADTFALFEREIENCSDKIHCEFVDSNILEAMPAIFPCYYKQPRTHVRICIMSVKEENIR